MKKEANSYKSEFEEGEEEKVNHNSAGAATKNKEQMKWTKCKNDDNIFMVNTLSVANKLM